MTVSERRRALVTGGAGFLGSHLCEALLRENVEVCCVDNLYTGSRNNISHLLADRRFEIIQHDVTVPLSIEVDEIYNLACPASPRHYQRDPVQTTRTCVHGSINMLDLALRERATILQASTSEVYGDPLVHPQAEDYFGHVNPVGPRSCYDEGKRCAETLFFDYHRQHGLHIKVGRIFNTYGPRMLPDDGRVVSNFIVSALTGQPIAIYGDGLQTRCFCYVEDLIEALQLLMRSPPEVTGPINLGSAEEIPIAELAALIVEMTGSRSPIVRRPAAEDDPRRRRPDTQRAERLLGWRARTPLQEGLRQTISYFESLLREDVLRIA
jgi:UDP-glucuronate decarboxylase